NARADAARPASDAPPVDAEARGSAPPASETGAIDDARPPGADAADPRRAPAKTDSRARAREPAQRSVAGRRWLRRLRLVVEIGTIVVAIPCLLLLCSVPDTGKLADDNPASTAFIDLRRAQAADAGKPFKLQWQWRPIGKISRYLRAGVVYAEDINFY